MVALGGCNGTGARNQTAKRRKLLHKKQSTARLLAAMEKQKRRNNKGRRASLGDATPSIPEEKALSRAESMRRISSCSQLIAAKKRQQAT